MTAKNTSQPQDEPGDNGNDPIDVEPIGIAVFSESTPEPEKPKSKSFEPQSAAKPRRNWVVWLALLLSLGAVAGLLGAYWLWHKQHSAEQQQLQQWQSQQSGKLQNLQQQIEQQLSQQLNQQLSSAEQRLQSSQSAQSKSAEQLKQQVDARLKAIETKIVEVSGRQPSDWTLAEANYLIRIAGRKLWLEHDSDTAKSLLASASVKISALGDPSLFPLAQAIAEDIATLSALPNPRLSDYHLTLSGLISGIENLPFNVIESRTLAMQSANAPAAESVTAQSNWLSNLLASLGELKRLVYIHSEVADDEVKAQLTTKQQWFIRANLKMTMVQAQLAVLNRDQRIYHDSIVRAIQLLETFKQSDSAVQATAAALRVLLDEPVDVTYPDQFRSQKLLQNILTLRLGSAVAPVVEKTPNPVDQHNQHNQLQGVQQ